jgi:fructokinase
VIAAMALQLQRGEQMRIGVDLGGTKIEFAAITADGRILGKNRMPTPTGDYGATIGAIRDGVLALEQEIGRTGSVGVGIPGSISPSTGRVRNANSTCLNGNFLTSDLEKALNRPVRLANDANCFALSEAIDGAGKGSDSVFGVILGTGVGGGLVIGGTAITGRNAISGEWGHNPLPWPGAGEAAGKECYCGQSGCIETHLSGPALSQAYQAASGDAAEAIQIAQLANAGDKIAKDVLAEYERKLARALSLVINILDPDVIVLGGGLSNIDRFYETVPVLWQEWVFSDAVATRLRPPLHGDSSGVRGAAWLWPATP